MARMGPCCWCDARPDHADLAFFLRIPIDKKIVSRNRNSIPSAGRNAECGLGTTYHQLNVFQTQFTTHSKAHKVP
jgi:hypothetical protein